MKRRKSETNVDISSRKRKHQSLELVDRLSALPDSILGVILSLLPTKNVVATSVLSKRWKFMWTIVHNLDFCHEVFSGKEDKNELMRFVRFVNSVLLHHDAGLLNKFRLVWRPSCMSSHATSWINTAITRNVRELCVCVECLLDQHGFPEAFDMPMSVFTCASLLSLELNGVIVSTTMLVCLPRLESLKLVSVYFRSQEAFEKLISGCPMLNSLHLHMPYYMLNDFGQDDDFSYIISSTSLRRLELFIENEKRETNDDDYCNLVLEASSLEYLKLVGFIPNIVQKCLSSLVEVDFRVHLHKYFFSIPNVCNSIVEAIRVFNYAKTLTLSADVMWALSCATISVSTEFKRLVKLETGTYCCYCISLRHFIQSSENLQVLAMYQDPDFLRMHDHSQWIAPVEVPRCLSNNLKKVVLDGYRGYEDEREMVRYMLKHGSSLEVMEVSCHNGRKGAKFELLQEICQFPRKSPTCEVKFFGVDIKEQEGLGAVTTAGRSHSNGVI